MPAQPTSDDKRAPMASAPMKYKEDGTADWGNMWDTFCELAQSGGPPHRGTMLQAQTDADTNHPDYQFATAEIIRGITEVSDLSAKASAPGWLEIACPMPGMAQWLAEAISQENVQARADGDKLFVPLGDYFTLKGEIKNVITAVAKTTHYWGEHLPVEVKQAMAAQVKMGQLSQRIRKWLGF